MTHALEARRLRWLLLFIAVLMAVGMVAPIITLEKLIFIENTFSIGSGVIQLLMEGQWLLFLVLSVFSIGLPIFKLITLWLILTPGHRDWARYNRMLELMHEYGKWSMLDVFVVAVLVVAVKLGALADVTMRPGLYAFAAGVLLTMIVTARVVRLSETVADPEPDSDPDTDQSQSRP